MGWKFGDLGTLKLLDRVISDVELATYAMLDVFDLHYNNLVLTSHLLGVINQLVPRCIFTVTLQSLVPLWQVQRRNHKLCQVFSVGERDDFVSSCARDGSRLVGDVYSKDKRAEIGFDVRHAVVVEEEAVIDLRPFKIGLA